MTDDKKTPPSATDSGAQGKGDAAVPAAPDESRSEELGGPKGPEPTRFGDWERNGRCSDF